MTSRMLQPFSLSAKPSTKSQTVSPLALIPKGNRLASRLTAATIYSVSDSQIPDSKVPRFQPRPLRRCHGLRCSHVQLRNPGRGEDVPGLPRRCHTTLDCSHHLPVVHQDRAAFSLLFLLPWPRAGADTWRLYFLWIPACEHPRHARPVADHVSYYGNLHHFDRSLYPLLPVRQPDEGPLVDTWREGCHSKTRQREPDGD